MYRCRQCEEWMESRLRVYDRFGAVSYTHLTAGLFGAYFEVVTFDFIPKPISEERLRVLFEKAGTYLNLTNQSFSFSYRRVRPKR